FPPLSFLFFFFQAEDGIRDGHVTGVQTCALPIFIPFTAKVSVGSIISRALTGPEGSFCGKSSFGPRSTETLAVNGMTCSAPVSRFRRRILPFWLYTISLAPGINA